MNQEQQGKIIANLFRPKFGISDTYREEAPQADAVEPSAEENYNNKTKFVRGGVSESDYSVLKIFAIIADIAILAFLFSYSLIMGLPFFVIIIAGVFLASSISLAPLLLKATILHVLVAIIAPTTIALTMFWLEGTNIIYIGVFVLLSALILFVGMVSAKQEINNSLRISFMKFTGAILPRIFIFISIVIAMIYGLNFKSEYLFSDRFISGVINVSSPIIAHYAPGFTQETKVRDLLAGIAERAIIQQNIPGVATQGEGMTEELVSQAVETSYKNIEDNFKIDINLDESFAVNARMVLATRVADAARTIPNHYLTLVAMIIIFIAMRSALWLFGWVVLSVAFFSYQFLLATKFAEVYLETRRKEVLLVK